MHMGILRTKWYFFQEPFKLEANTEAEWTPVDSDPT